MQHHHSPPQLVPNMALHLFDSLQPAVGQGVFVLSASGSSTSLQLPFWNPTTLPFLFYLNLLGLDLRYQIGTTKL
jgi:hypothetical protein